MRTRPEPTAGEADLLSAYLQAQREIVLAKCAGLSQEQLARPHPPSDLTLAGLLYHLALVEHMWLEVRFAGLPERPPFSGIDWDADPNWEFRTAAEMEPEELTAGYLEVAARSQALIAGAADLDQLSALPSRDGRRFSLRWVLLHLIEEIARHAGHADLIRESVDGAVGD